MPTKKIDLVSKDEWDTMEGNKECIVCTVVGTSQVEATKKIKPL